MNYQENANPYAQTPIHAEFAPEAAMEVTASRGLRLAARFIDGILNLALLVPVVFVLVWTGKLTGEDATNTVVLVELTLATILPVLIFQWQLIARTGQSLGKKWLGLRIVKTDGSDVDFVSGVMLREWIMLVVSFVPYVGSFAGLIDVLVIFGGDQRCVHDYFANTRVVKMISPRAG